MKEHVIQVWCDACLDEDAGLARNEAQTHTVVIDGNRAEIDVCERHRAGLLAPLLALMEARGVPAKHASPPVAGTPTGECPVCRLTMTKSGLANHVWNIHAPGQRPERTTTCPDCGQAFPDTRSVGAHRSQVHGYSALAEAMAAVNGSAR